ncbi:MAG: helix-turn-helix domain-containing protein [Saprospiraceae bacterium]|nr:helix-turn-helix domain-containing protein [Saprospiraceae bacterium]
MNTIESRKAKNNIIVLDMGQIYEKSDGKADVPHRHDYYTVLLIEQAEGEHIVDYKQFSFAPLEVHFVSPRQVHQVVLKQKPKGKAIVFDKDFLVSNNIPERFISNINLFRPFGDTPPLKIDPQSFKRLTRIIQEMEECLHVKLNYQNRALGALLQLFLIYCNNSTQLDNSQINEEQAEICILRDFKQLIEDKFKTWHKVKDYASAMHISAKHLSHTVKQVTGKVAKAHIQDRLLLEAKRLLLHTGIPIKEIAYAIGFEEPLHFSSFFKKNAGISASKFRER